MVPHTRYAILGLLAREPSYGYELAARFGELLGPGWRLNRGQVYDMLRTLEKAGLVEAMPGPPGAREVKRYCIKDAGEEVYTGWLAAPCTEAQPHRQAFYLKLALSRPKDAPRLLESIALREQACIDQLRDYAEEASSAPREAGDWDAWEILAREMIDEATTTHLHAELEWLGKMRSRIEARLESLQAASAPARELGAGQARAA